MTIFSNPTVKQVIFQIRFPNLFFIENKIGDFQLKIMEKFPESKLVFRRQLLFVDMGSEAKFEPSEAAEGEPTQKIWQFDNSAGTQFQISNDSLSITSVHHKSYDEGEDKFRDVIQLIVDNFLGISELPLITRMGLRYMNECPLPSPKKETFIEHYNSVFPLDRFDLESAREMSFRTVVSKSSHYLIYNEMYAVNQGNLILDLDAFSEKVPTSEYLQTADELHSIIKSEYFSVINEPVKEFMRQAPSDEQNS